MLSLGILRNASDLARTAVESVSDATTSLAGSIANKTAPSSSFADLLATEQSKSEVSVPEIRSKLTSAVEAVLARVGVPADPAMTLITNPDGTIELESDHERAVEIEANLNEDAAVQAFARQLAARGDGADRRLVIHTISA